MNPLNHNKSYTRKEEYLISQLYMRIPTSTLAVYFNRTPESIDKKAGNMGLKYIGTGSVDIGVDALLRSEYNELIDAIFDAGLDVFTEKMQSRAKLIDGIIHELYLLKNP